MIVRVNVGTRHRRTRTVPLKEERTRTTFMKHGKLSGSNYWSIFKFHLSNASIDWHTDNQGHWTVFSGLQMSTSFIYSIRQQEKGRLSSQRFKVWLLLFQKPMCFISFSVHKLAPVRPNFLLLPSPAFYIAFIIFYCLHFVCL